MRKYAIKILTKYTYIRLLIKIYFNKYNRFVKYTKNSTFISLINKLSGNKLCIIKNEISLVYGCDKCQINYIKQ